MYWNIRIKGSGNQFSQKCSFAEEFFIQAAKRKRKEAASYYQKDCPYQRRYSFSGHLCTVSRRKEKKKRWAREREKEFDKGAGFIFTTFIVNAFRSMKLFHYLFVRLICVALWQLLFGRRILLCVYRSRRIQDKDDKLLTTYGSFQGVWKCSLCFWRMQLMKLYQGH